MKKIVSFLTLGFVFYCSIVDLFAETVNKTFHDAIACCWERLGWVDSSGMLWGVGASWDGQLGTGVYENVLEPVVIDEGVRSVYRAPGITYHTKEDRTLWGLGENLFGQLGVVGDYEDQLSPVSIARNVANVSASSYTTLFVDDERVLWGLGLNRGYQLGLGGPYIDGRIVLPKKIADNVVQFASGKTSSFFIKKDYSLWGLGENNAFGLLKGSDEQKKPVLLDSNVRQVAAAGEDFYYLKRDGTLIYWRSESAPIESRILDRGVKYMSASREGGIRYIKDDDTLWGAGWNDYGQLGIGSIENQSEPVLINREVVGLSTGPLSMLYVKRDGTIWYAGRYETDFLDIGVVGNVLIPVQVLRGVNLMPDEPLSLNFAAVENDFNSDGWADLLWQSQSNGSLLCWNLDQSGHVSSRTWLTNGNYNGRFAGSSDIDGDGYLDLVFEEGSTGAVYASIWFGSSNQVYKPSDRIDLGVAGEGWRLVGVADLLENGTADLVWQHNDSGRVSVWGLDHSGTRISAGTLVGSMTDYRITAMSDLNNDGHDDVIWQKHKDGQTEIIVWYLGGDLQSLNRFVLARFSDTDFVLAGVADYNRDLNQDLLWQNKTTGQVLCWLLDDKQRRIGTLGMTGAQPREWRVGHWTSGVSVEVERMDYNNDGNADLVLQNSENGDLLCRHLDGKGNKVRDRLYSNTVNYGTFISSADINGDGLLDFVFQKAAGTDSSHASILYRSPFGDFGRTHHFGPSGATWILVGSGDLIENGVSDLVWQERNTGRVVVWGLDRDGNRISSGTLVGSMTDFRINAVGDLDGDGHDDVIWQRRTATHTECIVWYLDGSLGRGRSSMIARFAGFDYDLVAIADFNSDNHMDLLWSDFDTGNSSCWLLDGEQQKTGTIALNPPQAGWHVGHHLNLNQ